MTSSVLHSDQEGSFLSIDSVSFYGVKQKPSAVLVNSQEFPFIYRDNQVNSGVTGKVTLIAAAVFSGCVANVYYRSILIYDPD